MGLHMKIKDSKIKKGAIKATLASALYIATNIIAACPENHNNPNPGRLDRFPAGRTFVDEMLDFEETCGIKYADSAKIEWESMIASLRPIVKARYDKTNFTRENAKRVAETIDSVILAEKYFYDLKNCTDYRLTRTILTKGGDCSRFSMMYYAIGQELGLPLTLVRIPGHIFARWELSDSTYMNWEPQPIRKKNSWGDNYYTKWKHIDSTAIKNGVYLRSLKEKDVLSFLYEREALIIKLQAQNEIASMDDSQISVDKKTISTASLERRKQYNTIAVMLDSLNSIALLNLAVVQFQLREYTEAYANIEKNLEMNPTHPLIRYMKAITCCKYQTKKDPDNMMQDVMHAQKSPKTSWQYKIYPQY